MRKNYVAQIIIIIIIDQTSFCYCQSRRHISINPEEGS
jgi:hypothetical protein